MQQKQNKMDRLDYVQRQSYKAWKLLKLFGASQKDIKNAHRQFCSDFNAFADIATTAAERGLL